MNRTLRSRLGRSLHPVAVTDAWYAAGCPPDFDPQVPVWVVARWRVACWLRNARIAPQP